METVAEEPLCGMCHCQFVLLVLVLFHFHFYLFIVGYGDTILKLTMTCGQGFKFIFEFSLSSLLFFSLDQNSEVKQKLGASEKDKEVCCLEITIDSLASPGVFISTCRKWLGLVFNFIFCDAIQICLLIFSQFVFFMCDKLHVLLL